MKNGLVVDSNGNKLWYKDDLLHREDGPAIEWANGLKYWYKNDKCHREDGPAFEGANGYKAWYYHGKKVNCSSQQEFERLVKLKIFW